MADETVTVVLVHGANHGPWCWDRVVPMLRDRGLRVVTPDLYERPDPTDPTVVQAAVDAALDGPVVVVGHSFGGYSISRLDPATVDHLVYLAAIVPGDEGVLGFPVPDTFFDMMEFADGWMNPKLDRLRELWYHDCTDDDIAWCASMMRPHPSGAIPDAFQQPAWREVPSTYAVCEQDATLRPEYQRAAGELFGRSVSWPTSHSPFLSRPELVVDLLTSIAAELGARA